MPAQVTNYKCPTCTGPLHFVGASGKLECDYCGASYDVAQIEALYAEKEGKAAAAQQSAEEKAAVKAGIKEGLESLSGKIPGLVDIHVNIDALPSSNADLMLDTTFTDAAALKGYSTHPAHVAVADGKVRPYTKTRVCLDFEV